MMRRASLLLVIPAVLLGACGFPRLPSIPGGPSGSSRPSSIEEYERQVEEYEAKLAGAKAGLDAARESARIKRIEALAYVGIAAGAILFFASILAAIFVAPLRAYAFGGAIAGAVVIALSFGLMKAAPYLAWIGAGIAGLALVVAAGILIYRFRRHDTALGRLIGKSTVEPMELGDCFALVEDARKRQRPRRI